MKIAIGSDHGGYDVKEAVKKKLIAAGHEVDDVGTDSKESVDYPDFGRDVALKIAGGEADEGILVCTTGIGMSMIANRFRKVRAALCLFPAMAEKAKLHNNANVLVLSGGLVDMNTNMSIVDEWFKHKFVPGDRHERRVKKIEEYGEQRF